MADLNITLTNVAAEDVANAHYADVANPHQTTKAQVGLSNVDNTTDLGKPISTATQSALDLKADLIGGKVPASQLPAFVDDVLEFANLAAFPATGEADKIYIAIDTNLTYRWSGSAYVEISASLALGETSATAYRGDRGKTAYDHSQITNGNPHGTTKSDLGLGSVDNTADTAKPVSTAQQTALNLKADLSSPTLTGTPAAPTAGAGTNTTQLATTAFVKAAVDVKSEFFGVAMSDETTVLGAASTSVPLATMHVPYAMTLTQVFAGLRTAGTGAAVVTVDIHLNGTSIMTTTKILFTASVKLSANGTLTTTTLAAGDYLEFFLDVRDTNNVATGLKCYLIGHQ